LIAMKNDASEHELGSELKRRLFFARRAWRRRCPQCGEGGLFEGYARLRMQCESCGLVFRREQGAMTGSMYFSAVVTELFAALLVAIVWLCTSWSTTTSLLVSVPILVVFTYWFLPRSMALWTSTEYATDVFNGESWAKPR
jgi:uncharacterized protein (DUF983 family)